MKGFKNVFDHWRTYKSFLSRIAYDPETFIWPTVMNIQMGAGIQRGLSSDTGNIVVGKVGRHQSTAWAASYRTGAAERHLLANYIGLKLKEK